jgi:asparaginyl-tRNA synthetase
MSSWEDDVSQMTEQTTEDRLGQVAAVEQAALSALRRHYAARGLCEVSVPVIVGITGACENVSTLFEIGGARRAHLTQTGQLALEHALCELPGVVCVTRSFRTDRVDARHLHEFTLVEEEITCAHPAIGLPAAAYDEDAMFEGLLREMEAALRSVVRGVADDARGEAVGLGADPVTLDDPDRLAFHRISYADAVELLNRDGRVERLRWADDLQRVHETRLVRLVAERAGTEPMPTFVTHFPKDIKFFNMRVSHSSPRVVLSADLLLPGVGEAMGGAVREHVHARLVERLRSSTMLRHMEERGLGGLSDFDAYLALSRDHRTLPHAGYGLGLERALQYVLREPDIRQVSATYLLSQAMGFAGVLADMQAGSVSPGF